VNLRWLWFAICLALSAVLLGAGLLVPAHLRAVDASVLLVAGRNGPSLPEQIRALAEEKKWGAASLLAQAARQAQIPDADAWDATVTNWMRQSPGTVFWGDDERTAKIFGNPLTLTEAPWPLTDFLIRPENREAALAHLGESPVAAVQELLRVRSLNDTVLFPPSSSASGQALDAAIAIGGLLLDGNRLTPDLSRQIFNLARRANGGSSEPLEQTLMDFLSLGRRFNWDQLTTFVAEIRRVSTLQRLAAEARAADENLPVLFAAVQLSGQPAAVADYLAAFPETGWRDLKAGLRYGAGGVAELVKSRKRFYDSTVERRLTAYDPFGAFYFRAANVTAQRPRLALTAKWFLYLLAGFFAALALHCARPAVSPLERPLQVRGFHLAREFLFSLAFLLAVLLLSEPFLAQESQNRQGIFSLRLIPSTAGGTVPAGIAGFKQTVMNPTIVLTLLVFFVLQALLYVSSLVKLAEIRRQNVPPRMKLKLLENEDHLFDAGLYLGFVGTIVSLIIASLGLVKFSLMAAYSSTSFGIVFVVIFKIFHLRPARRKWLLEAEAQEAPTPAPAAPAPALS